MTKDEFIKLTVAINMKGEWEKWLLTVTSY